ncbi:MAG: radical SAM protein [uncultured bacterium]|nr:MAG: radical SAM protein [uncultured bacterium]
MEDENFGPEKTGEIDADIIGINLVGAPYIPKAISMIRDRVRSGAGVVLGGQIVNALSKEEFARLFSGIRDDVEVVNGNDDLVLEKTFWLQGPMSPKEMVSQVPVWEKINDAKMKKYLNREFSYYVSQGCTFNCKFCQAEKGKKEKYRDLNVVQEELEYLAGKAVSFGIEKLSFYMSNLDGFQTPEKLLEFAKIVESVKRKFGIKIEFRCLATLEFFLRAVKNHEGILPTLRNAGFTSVGFGIDGATPEVWRAIGKSHNIGDKDKEGLQKSIDAISICAENGITPEILMVFGHPTDTQESLETALDFVQDMANRYGAVPRPHVAKHIIPGADAWRAKENQDIVSQLIENPEYFQALDYAALASEISHPDAELRKWTNKYYQAMCAMSDRATKYVYPDTPLFREEMARDGTTVERVNQGRFDR